MVDKTGSRKLEEYIHFDEKYDNEWIKVDSNYLEQNLNSFDDNENFINVSRHEVEVIEEAESNAAIVESCVIENNDNNENNTADISKNNKVAIEDNEVNLLKEDLAQRFENNLATEKDLFVNNSPKWWNVLNPSETLFLSSAVLVGASILAIAASRLSKR